MSGYFKLVDAHEGSYRIKLVAGDGTLMAVSTTFETKQEAAAGIAQLREIAGTGPVIDQSRDADVLGEARNSGRKAAAS
ncbi:YegP family protein [Arthrobacter zhaoxinii]|uniref:YegP family protein n=1 Tax=Arthrobacter zhaoxinii TaxID=2964616 RepID=A0ABY5YUL2_9MICC|nr:YegP family protein [Arthrobacter zhaoxinii]UWX97684.1 YegP family protein [Arthrobacter zhaoxinii]